MRIEVIFKIILLLRFLASLHSHFLPCIGGISLALCAEVLESGFFVASEEGFFDIFHLLSPEIVLVFSVL